MGRARFGGSGPFLFPTITDERHDPLTAILAFALMGAAAGGIGALFGIGGGLVLVPGLTLLGGLPFHAAVGVSLVAVVAMSVASTAVHLRAGRVELDTGVRLQFFAALGALGAAYAAGLIPSQVLFACFGVLLIYVAIIMAGNGDHPPSEGSHSARIRLASASSLGAGVVAGLLGVGGGIINTPILNKLLHMPLEKAIATSSYMIGVTGSAAALAFLARGDIDVVIAGPVVLGVLVGASAVAFIGHRIETRVLRVSFSLLLLVVAAQMIRQAFA